MGVSQLSNATATRAPSGAAADPPGGPDDPYGIYRPVGERRGAREARHHRAPGRARQSPGGPGPGPSGPAGLAGRAGPVPPGYRMAARGGGFFRRMLRGPWTWRRIATIVGIAVRARHRAPGHLDRRRLRGDADPKRRVAGRAAAELDRVLRQRQERGRHLRQHRQAIADLQPDTGGAEERRARRGGPAVLHRGRGLTDRHPPRHLQRPHGRIDPGRLHHHPAVRQELLREHRDPADGLKEAQGDLRLDEAGQAEVENLDPHPVPEHDLPGQRRLRRGRGSRRLYFGVPASKLSVAQAATLAAIIQSPGFYPTSAPGARRH